MKGKKNGRVLYILKSPDKYRDSLLFVPKT